MKKRITLNYVYNVAYQILLVLTPLITTPYISRVLGANGIGKYSYANSIVSYFVIFAGLGTATLGKREVSYVQDNVKERSIVFWETEITCACMSLLATVLYGFTVLKNTSFSIIYTVLILNILSVGVNITWFYQGLEEFGKIVIRNVVIKLLSIICIFTFVKTEEDLWIYVMCMVAPLFLGNMALWIGLPQYIQKVSISELDLKRNIMENIKLFIPTIAVQIYTVVDKTMLGLFAENAVENGYYEQAEKVAKIALSVVTSLPVVIAPRIGKLISENRKNDILDYMYRSYSIVWAMSIPIFFGIAAIASNLVPWFYGNEFTKVVGLLYILGFLAVPIGINNVTSFQYLIPMKKENIFTKTVFIGALINFVLNMILIPRFFSVGAAIASVFAETVIALVQIIYIRNELSLIKILSCAKKYFVAGLCMFVIVKILSAYMPSSPVFTVLLIITGMTCYSILVVSLKDIIAIEILNSVAVLLKKKIVKE